MKNEDGSVLNIPLVNGMLWIDSDFDICVYKDGKWTKLKNGLPSSSEFLCGPDVMGGGSYGRGG